MSKFSILAVMTTVVAMASAPALALPGGFAPGGNGPGGCGLCGPGNFAPNPGGGGGGGGSGGGDSSSPGDPFMPGLAETCGPSLSQLRPVKVSQIRGVEPGDSVDIVPVCADDLQSNIAQLRPHIARNDVLDGELGRSGLDAGDVIGVKVRGSSVILYVH
jgi:hypothetical protein